MHEYSIVQALIEQCEEIARNNDATKVLKVVVKIGVLSGVEVQLLQIAFDTFKEQSICHDAELVINVQKIKTACQECGFEEELESLESLEYFCKRCHSENVKLIDGEEMLLMSLEME
jgi:hydrogenase nickel incorporation protein HypA/HybF